MHPILSCLHQFSIPTKNMYNITPLLAFHKAEVGVPPAPAKVPAVTVYELEKQKAAQAALDQSIAVMHKFIVDGTY